MFYTFVFLTCLTIFTASMFTGGKSWRDVREKFYGNYFAEDGLINSTDKPNTLQAFQNCIDNGIGIKTEVHLTKDHRVAISTYENLSKEYGVDMKISESTMDELEAVGVMSLQSLVDMAAGSVPLILELKVGLNNRILCRATADIIKASKHKNIAVCSYQAGIVGWFRNREKDIFRGIVSAPAKDFKNLPKFERFMTGNLGNNGSARPNFTLYRNKPQSLLVKFAILSGVLNGVWTIDNAEEGKRLEAEKDMIIVRGYMPETVHFRDMPVPQNNQPQNGDEDTEKQIVSAPVRRRSIAEILAEDDDYSEESTLNEIKEEAAEFFEEVKEEISETAEEIKEELIEIREKLITEE